MLYALSDLHTQLGDKSLEAARQLLQSGCEITPSVQRGGELITAAVKRPDAAPLRVYVKTHKTAAGLEIAGECSCHERRNCQHVAAVLLQALANEHTPRSRGSRAGPAAAPTQATSAATHQQLMYVLCPEGSPAMTLPVATFTAQRLPDGGYAATKHYDCAWALRAAVPPRFITPEDLDYLTTLATFKRDELLNAPCLSGAEGNRLLTGLLNTGRCHYRDLLGHPLTPGPSRPLSFEWRMDQHGYQHLQWKVIPAARLLPLQPPRYLDEHTRQCGPIDTALTPQTLASLLASPPIAPDETAAMQAAMDHRFATAALPPLQQLEVQQLPAIQPQPRLLLKSGTHIADLARLSFDYAGRRIGRGTPSTWHEGHCVVNIQRDESFESACAAQLLSLGFEAANPQREHSGGDDFTRPGPHQAWLDFLLHSAPQLRQQGWQIECDRNFVYPLIHGEQWYGDVSPTDDRDWFNVSIGVNVNGERINLLPALVNLLQNVPDTFRRRHSNPNQPFLLRLEDGRLLPVPHERLHTILDTLFELHDANALDARHRLRLNRIQLTRLGELDDAVQDTTLAWHGAGEWRQLAERLRGIDRIAAVTPPQGLQANLRPYQQRGLDWLQFLREYALAGILADDMGLGKTVQTLAHLLKEKERGRAQRPSLIIAPTSLMANWRREANRFAPDLKVLILHGPRRHARFNDITRHDVVLTTYALLARDCDALLAHRYHMLILDEAQIIKNPKAQASLLVRRIYAQYRLCLTGTPLENHLGELWSLFDFLLPGLLGTRQQFRRVFRSPIENDNDRDAATLLARRIRPFMLRRTKDAVATELPPKTEILRSVALDDPQRDLYETIRLAMHERVRQEIARKGIANSQIVILDALLKLRQVCCDPRLVNMESARQMNSSAKLTLLMDLLPEMIDEGRSILLFSQFTSMLKLIENELPSAGIEYVKLTGQTRDRATPVARFQRREIPLFLISLKAGGVGLNLTAADTVIHYDPWWNPAVERQATDRAHRIGQDNPVFAYKLISEGTVEERVHAMQQRKQALADTLYGNTATAEPRWTEDDLDLLFEPLQK